MSKYSVVTPTKVLDYGFKKLSKGTYNFYVGDIFLGQLFGCGKRGWSCVSFKVRSGLCPINGFKTRLDACEMLLKINGFDKRGRNEME